MSYATIARIDEGATGSRDGILDGAGILLAADGAKRVGGDLRGAVLDIPAQERGSERSYRLHGDEGVDVSKALTRTREKHEEEISRGMYLGKGLEGFGED